MEEAKRKPAFLVFDIETVADGELISRVRYPAAGLSPAAAVARYRAELMAEKGKDILPTTFMLPIALAIAKVDATGRLVDLSVLDAPLYRPHEITKRFWQGWLHYGRPALVTFNGRGYDIPVLELAAYRYGLSVPTWFNVEARTYEQSRNRYNLESHFDMYDLFSNFGASQVTGGLNLLANLIGKPGKNSMDGSKVQDMYDAGRVEEINDYCRCDVLDTYFVFLRSRVLLGKLSLEEEHVIVAETKQWLKQQAEASPAYRQYLEHWGDWRLPE
jgi:predicted PolB exonuclease-like 3'-5' exonuclease